MLNNRNRRHLLQRLPALAALAWAGGCARTASAQSSASVLAKPIPSSGEPMPVVGLGTWITFNVGNDRVAQDASAEVIQAFFAGGGRMVDSSPMYGSSQATVGHGLARAKPAALFSAEKVWTSSEFARAPQAARLGRERTRL